MKSTDGQVLEAVPVSERVSRDEQPGWVTSELPAEYGELAARIKALEDEARKFETVAAVLWQTGTPLVRAVHDLFDALGYRAEPSESGAASYDLAVKLEDGRRLLVEVVGGPEAMTRRSPQISQVLRTLQEEAGDGDRVVVVANAFADLPLADRRQEAVQGDALRLIQGLGANFITTATLFGVWRYSLKDMAGARKSITRLHAQDGGIFR
ncbi:MAG TPA: hypothetical protein VMM93_00360 [Vicinamibacterales bacterium]|nr:hypothetical protein [Vicinamibacterales bacterium]